jgi:hypothetical protein
MLPLFRAVGWRVSGPDAGVVDLYDDVATRVQVLFYSEGVDALRQVLHKR